VRTLLRHRPSPALVVACVALLVALTGTGVAAVTQLAPNSVTTSSIRNGAVTAPKLANGAVVTAKLKNAAVGRNKIAGNAINSAKVANGSLQASDFAAGQIPAGPKGDKGDAGPPGPSNAYATFLDGPTAVPAALTALKTLNIPQAGSYVAVAKAYFTIGAAAAVVTCRLQAEGDFDQSQTYVAATAPWTLSLNVVHTFNAAGSVSFSCSTSAGAPQANFIKISAIRVGELVNSA
jgi:hypothetical protein